MSKLEIKQQALKQLTKLKLEQLNEVRDSFPFSHPIAYEVIWLSSQSPRAFDTIYNDDRMFSILNDSYAEFQTVKSREQLRIELDKWAIENGYSYDDIFK